MTELIAEIIYWSIFAFFVLLFFGIFILNPVCFILFKLVEGRHSKNWKCRLGFHDWQIVDVHDESDIMTVVDPWIKRVCLREDCRLIDDEITPHLESLQERERREQKAQVILDEK